MGIHGSQRIELYWRNKPSEGPVHSVRLYMPLKRFQQIKRFLHISTSNSMPLNEKKWWYKLDPLVTKNSKRIRRDTTRLAPRFPLTR